MTVQALVVGATALAVSAVAQAGLVRWLPRWGVVDVPNARSSHVAPTPRGGGIGVALGMAAGAGVAAAWTLTGSTSPLASGVAAGALVLLALIGLVDDVRGLPAGVRFAVMLVSGAALAVAFDAGPWQIVLVGIWITACTNAVNFMDGINGMAGATSVVAGAWYAMSGLIQGEVLPVALGAAAAGAAVGFLPFNVPRAKLFLGDSGSYLLGATFAVCSSVLWLDGASLVVAMAPLVPYLADTGSTLMRRAFRREPLLRAHRDHVYQRLSRERFTHLEVSAGAATLAAACCAAALALPTTWAAVILIAFSGLYIGSPALLRVPPTASARAPS